MSLNPTIGDKRGGQTHGERTRGERTRGEQTLGQDGSVPAELSHAGAVIDKAIEYMLGENLPPLAIASALLGGSLGLLARTMDEKAMTRMLENAIASVRAGELHPSNDREAGRA